MESSYITNSIISTRDDQPAFGFDNDSKPTFVRLDRYLIMPLEQVPAEARSALGIDADPPAAAV